MKWLIYYNEIYFEGKGDTYSRPKIIGYSNKSEQELFEILEKEYPKLPIRKKVKNSYLNDYLDKYNKHDLPYCDFVFFEEGTLKEF